MSYPAAGWFLETLQNFHDTNFILQLFCTELRYPWNRRQREGKYLCTNSGPTNFRFALVQVVGARKCVAALHWSSTWNVSALSTWFCSRCCATRGHFASRTARGAASASCWSVPIIRLRNTTTLSWCGYQRDNAAVNDYFTSHFCLLLHTTILA